MKFAVPLTAAALLLAAASDSRARTFSSRDGRTMEGTLVSAATDSVVIMRHSDQKEITVRRDSLSADDQKWIVEWQQTRGQLKFTIEAARDRVKKDTTRTPLAGGVAKATAEEWRYLIKITNKVKEPLPPLIYFYSEYVDQVDKLAGGGKAGKRLVVREVTGILATPEIAPFGTATITTQPIRVETMDALSATTSRNAGGGTTTTVASEKWIQSLTGLNIEAWWKRRLAEEYNYGGCREYGIQMEDQEKEKVLAITDYKPVAADGLLTPQVWRVAGGKAPPPNDNWAKAGYADGAWQQVRSPLLWLPRDTAEPGEETQRSLALRQNAVVLARRVFNVAPNTDLKNLCVRYLAGAAEMEIYLDGELICTPPANGAAYATEPVKPEIAQKLVAPGPHILAIKASGFPAPVAPQPLQPGRPAAPGPGAPGIDAGLYIEPAAPGAPPAK